MDEANSADKDAGHSDATSTTKVREARATLEEMTIGNAVEHRYQPKAARVRSVRRLLNWFKSCFGQSDL